MLNLNELSTIDDIKYAVLSLTHNIYVLDTLQEFQTYDSAHDYVKGIMAHKKPVICFARDAEEVARRLSKERGTSMLNKAIERKLKDKEAIDLSGYPRTKEGDYELGFDDHGKISDMIEGKDLCDAKTEQWIWSVGCHFKSRRVVASTTNKFYMDPNWECIWLR